MNENYSDTNFYIETNPILAHAVELNQKYDSGFFFKSIPYKQNCNFLNLTNLKIAHQKVLETKHPECLILRLF